MKKQLQLLFLALIVSVQMKSQAGAALNFDGIDDYVINTTPAIPGLSAFTFETWINVNNTSNGKIFSSNEMEVAVAGGQINFYCPAFSGNNISVIPIGVWKHIAITYDGAKLNFFIDGVLDNTIATTGTIGTNTGYKIGKHVSAGCCLLDGSLDELRIWNIARTRCEIISYMGCEIPSSSAGLIANYHFNQGFASANNSIETTLMDASGNSNVGILTNFSLNGTTSNWIAPGAVITGYTTTAVCALGAALNFDGVDDYVSVATVTNIPVGNSPYSIEAKIKPITLGVEGIAGWGTFGTTNEVNALRIDGSGNIINYWWGPDLIVSSSPVNMADGNWHHVAATFDGTTRKIYLDGVLKGFDTPGNHTVPNATNLRIGSTNYGEFFNGGLDEVRIWNIARTNCEIISYMDCEIPSSAPGLVANYHFNQAISGGINSNETNLIDVSSSVNNGTLNNFALTGTSSNWIAPGGVVSGFTTATVCSLAAALNFDGIDDYVSISSNASLSMTSAITIEAWVKTNGSPTGEQYIITKSNDSYFVGLNVAGNVGRASFYINGVSTGWLYSNSTSINDNNWHHIASTYDGSVIKIYIDGILDNSVIASGNIVTGGSDVVIGCRIFNYFFQGNIDETRIWNVARSQCEINTYMNCEIPSSSGGLVANYHFNQGISSENNSIETTLMDASVNSNVGTLTNFALSGATSNWIAPAAVVSGYTTTLAASTISVNSGAICAGQSFTMTPSGAATYSYSNGSDVAMPTSYATYTVSGTASTGCSAIDAIASVTINALPTLTVNSGAICAGSNFTIIPTGANTYTYSSGSAIVTPTANDTYTVTGTDINMCTNTAVASVTVNALPTLTVNSGAICTGSNFIIIPTGASTYTYSSGSAVVTPTTNASYNVTGTSALGCVSSNAAVSSVTVNALPTLVVSTTNTLLCAGQAATLSVSGASNYTWSTNQTTMNIAVTPTTQTTYSVTGTDVNGCTNSAVIIQNASLCTDLADLNSHSTILVYPNPANGMVTIDLGSANDHVKVEITNAIGQVVLSETTSNQRLIVDVATLNNGIYFVKVYEQNNNFTVKLVKQN